MRSMTGFGRGREVMPGVTVSVEIRSVNGKQREVRFRLPAELNAHEPELRSAVQEQVARGRVEIHVSLERPEGRPVTLRCNRDMVASLVDAAHDLQERHRLPGKVDLPLVLSTPGVLEVVPASVEDDEELAGVVMRALRAALSAHAESRQAEGSRLQTDLEARMRTITRLRQEIDVLAPDSVTRAAERLRARIAELVSGVPMDEARLAQEVAYLSDRSDITEELVRLASHLEEAAAALRASRKDPVGRRLDFLVQEILREANTIGNKTADLRISKAALEIKNEVEKIREQVQNVE